MYGDDVTPETIKRKDGRVDAKPRRRESSEMLNGLVPQVSLRLAGSSKIKARRGMAPDPVKTAHPSLACAAGRRATNEVPGLNPASLLGMMGKGKPKTMTAAAIAQRKRAGFKKGNKAAVRK